MKKLILVLGVVTVTILAAILAFDSSSKPSANNEGLPKAATNMAKK